MYRRGSRKQDLITMLKLALLKGDMEKARRVCDVGAKEFKMGFTAKDFEKYLQEVGKD